MPWHTQTYDFSKLEVNRSVKYTDVVSLCITSILFAYCRRIDNVLGFSRETLAALIANIEGREWCRIENIRSGWKPEHPRASSFNDVECFFSMMRDSIGQDFTTFPQGLYRIH